MRLGLIGLPQSGKTTIFNVLTRGDQPVISSGGRFEVHTAVVDVPDHRVDQLAALFKPQRVIHAKVTYADIAGLEAGRAGSISGALLNQLSQMDGFLHVVRCFENPSVPHPAGSLDPQRDVNQIDSELILNDLISVERKIERLGEERRKGGGRDKSQIEREMELFKRMHAALSDEIPLRDIDFSPEEERILSGFGLLTRKPMLIVLNLGDDQAPPRLDYPHRRSAILSLPGKLEMEIAQLPPEEAREFLAEYGIEESGLERVIHTSYQLLGLLSFFTIGPDEVRAWTVPTGTTAYMAAGEIHTDIQKGFIRAEVIAWDELINLGGLSEARAKGRLRLEGKDYILRDGEVMHVRFNI